MTETVFLTCGCAVERPENPPFTASGRVVVRVVTPCAEHDIYGLIGVRWEMLAPDAVVSQRGRSGLALA